MQLYKSILLILTMVMCFGVFSSNAQVDNLELKQMFDDDQFARNADVINWDSLNVQDSIRLSQLLNLIQRSKVKTSKDYHRAALIFQHGEDSLAYNMAVECMKKAIELDSTIDKWLLAAAIDRELMSRLKPQIYGTQFVKTGANGKWQLYTIDSTIITDKERENYGVETLAQQRITVREMNLKPLLIAYKTKQDVGTVINLIHSEIRKGNSAEYAVSEQSINQLGYELVQLNKLQDALQIFKLNTSLHPKCYKTFNSLGECLMVLKMNTDAINAFKASLKLEPKNRNAIEKLKNLNH